MASDKRDQLYSSLIGSGKVGEDEIGSLDEFKKALKDEQSSRAFYRNLSASGLFDEEEIGDEDDFYNSISDDFAKPSSGSALQQSLTQRTDPYAHVKQAERVKSERYTPTPAERARYSQTMDDIGRSIDAGMERFERKSQNLQQRQGLSVPQRINLGETNNLREGEQQLDEEARIRQWRKEHPKEALEQDIDSQIEELEAKYNAAVQKAIGETNPTSVVMGLAMPGLATPSMAMAGANTQLNQKLKTSPEIQDMEIALNDLRQAKTRMERNKQLHASSDFLGGVGLPFTNDWFNNWKNFGVGVWDTLKDPSLYDFGISDLKKASAYARIKNKMESGKELTDQETAIALAGMSLSHAQEIAEIPHGYTAGVTTTEMAPFMLQMAMNPGSGIGKSFARKAVRQYGRNGIKAVSARVGARVLGNIAEGAVLANTLQVPGTIANVMQRYTGDSFEYGDDGKLKIGHYETQPDGTSEFVEGGKGLARSVWEGEAAMIIENFTELGFGGNMNKFLGKVANSGLGQKMGLGYLSDLVGKVGSTPFARNMKRFMERTHWDGMIEEPLEEEYGIILNSLLTGDNSLSDLWDSEQQIDIFAGTMWFGGMMAAMNTAAYPYYRRKVKQQLNQADVFGQVTFGDEWAVIKDGIDEMADKDIASYLYDVKGNDAFSNDQKAALFAYVSRLKQYQGASTADMLMRIEGNLSKEETDVRNAYDRGAELTEPKDMNEAKNMLDYQRERLSEIAGDSGAEVVESDPVGVLGYVVNSQSWTDEDKQVVMDYVNARMTYDGMIDRVNDDIDGQIAASDAMIDKRANRQDPSVVVPATLTDDREVSILSGIVVMLDDGSGVDRQKSLEANGGDGMILTVGEDGKVEAHSLEEFRSVDEAIPVQQMKDEAAANIRQMTAQTAADNIDGILPFAHGDQYTVLGEDGQPHSVEVFEDQGDGTVAVFMDGMPQAVVMSKEQVQAMSDAYRQEEVRIQPAGETAGVVAGEAAGDAAGVEAGTVAEEQGEGQVASALDKIPVSTDEKGKPILNKKGKPQREWHKASVEDTADALIETTQGNMLDARNTAGDLVNQSKEKLEKIRKQKPKGEDPEELAESRAAIRRAEEEQQAIIKHWQNVGQEIKRRMDAEAAARQAEIEASKSEEQRQREAEEARIRRERQDKEARQRLREQIERDRERATREYEPLVKARKELADDPEAVAVLNDTEPRSLEEWVSSLLRPHSLLWLDASETERGLQSELGWKQSDMQRMMTLLGTKESGAKPFGSAVLEIYEGLSDAMKEMYTDEDVRRVLLDLFNEGNSRRMLHLTEEHRIEEAQEVYYENMRREAEAEMDAWVEANHLTPEERETYDEFIMGETAAMSQLTEQLEQIFNEDEQDTSSQRVDSQHPSGTVGRESEGSQGEVQRQGAAETSGADTQQQGQQGTEASAGVKDVPGTDVSGGTSVGRWGLSEKRALNGERFYQDATGNIDLVDIPQDVFDKINYTKAPFRITESMALHVFEQHAKELHLQGIEDAIDFVVDVMRNFDHVRLGDNGSLIFSIENGRKTTGKRAITILLSSDNGDYYGIKTSGYETLSKLKKRPLLWEGSAKTPSTATATEPVTSRDARQSGEQSGSASGQSGLSESKDTKNISNEQENLGKTSSAEEIAAEEAKVDTHPSKAQKEAGNYQMGHVNIDGFDVTIENPKGSVRSGVDANGNPWSVTMNNTYGYIRGTEGVDGDHIDVFLSDNPASGKVWVIDQVKPDGSFDEHKVMYGFVNAMDATNAYLSNYSEGWQGLGAISGISREEFKKWVESSHRKTKPFREYAMAKSAEKPEQPAKKEHKRLISDEKMEELRRQLLEKMNNTNIGVDPERMLIGAMYAVGKIERGFTKFADYATEMVNDLGDFIRPYLKSFYNAVRDMPEAQEYAAEMDDYDTVAKFDVFNFDKEKAPDVFTKAEQVSKEQKVTRQAKKVKQEQPDLFGDLFAEAQQPKVEEAQSKQEEPKYRPLTEADLDNGNPTVYYQGKPSHVMIVTREGEQTSAMTFSKPHISSVVLANGKSVKLSDLMVRDDANGKPATSKKLSAWWSDPNRPASIDRNDWHTYTTDEAKAYFEQFKSADGKTDFTKWAHPNLAYITAATWDGVEIPYEALKNIPEIIEAENAIKESVANGSLEISDEEVEKLAQRLIDSAEAKQDRKALVIIGLPAGGKSSVFANPLSKQYGARIIDSDDVKPWLEGFDGGNGAGYVHDASAKVAERAIDLAVGRGDNIIIPRIGGKSVMELSAALRLAGYDVGMYFNDVKGVTSIDRAASRFAQTGRYLSLDYLTKKAGVPSENFSNFAEKTIGGYLDERTEKELQNVRGRLQRLLGKLDGSRERLWQSYAAQRAGEGTSEGTVQTALGSRELQSGGSDVSVPLDEPLFNYAEWKSNDVAIGDKPKEIWNSKSGTPLSDVINQQNNGRKRERTPEADRMQRQGNSPQGTGRADRQGSSGLPSGESTRSRTADQGRLGSGVQERGNERQGDSGIQEAERANSSTSESVGRQSGAVQQLEPKNLRNNHAEQGKDYAPKGVDARIEANIKAIELMQQLTESGEVATPEQMAVLRKYSGWGGLGKAFDDATYSNRLRELLGEEAYHEAVMSRNSAYFTPAMVIDAMWNIAKAMGFKGGNVLEGSAGIGNILGLMPTDMSERSNIRAVEIDSTTGNILKLLYPDAQVDIQGFENTRVENGSVDLAITNVPFVPGLLVPKDNTGDADLSKKFRNSLQDFCIAKNIRKLKDGGIGIFITSRSTLDSSKKLRDWITSEGNADVVGAFRLNNETFGGTGATSDIIVVRKRVNGKTSANSIDVSVTSAERTAEYDTGEEKKVKGQWVPVVKQLSMDYNKYLVEHPDMMGGKMYFGFEKGDTYRPTSKALYPEKGIDQPQRLEEWSKSFEGKDWEKPAADATGTVTDTVYEELGADIKEGSMLIDGQGRLCVAQFGKAVPLTINDNKVKGHTKQECFKSYQNIKQALSDVLAYQTEHDDNDGLQPLLDKLNKAFDSFVNTYGHLHKNNQLAFLKNDIDFPNVFALETYSETGDPKTGKRIQHFGKTDVFKKRVVEKEKTPHPDNIKDALIASIYRSNGIDLDWIAEKLNESDVKSPSGNEWTREDVRKGILVSGLGFENPDTRGIDVAYEYLSGNVRQKLQQAIDNNQDGRYDANIRALEKVMPMTIPAHLIDFSIGSSWIDPKLYEEYVKEKTDIDVQFTPAGGTWYMKTPYYIGEQKNRAMGVTSEMLHKTIFGTDLIEAAMTNKTITVSETRKKWDGSTETTVDKEATQACASKIDEIRQDFKDWAKAKMQASPEMAQRVEKQYNDQFNNYVPKSIPDEFVPQHFTGASIVYTLQPHQAKAAIRATTQPLLLAHEVGSGKTFTLITAAMEMRRLGTARKPMIVVQNATLAQFVSDAKALYPNAKVLTLDDKDHTAEGRKNFYARIKYNDWDLIVVPQSVFERIPDSEERQMAYIRDKIQEKLLVLEQMKDVDKQGNSAIVRQAEKEIEKLQDSLVDLSAAIADKRKKRDEKKAAVTRQNAEVKAKEMLDRQTDDVENFDDMGIDALLVDEAHEYKHLGFATAMQRGVKGVDPSYSKKAQGVYLKTQAVLEKNNGRNVVFATGTPISNTAAEIWTFMRYLMPAETMKDYGIFYFDDFVRNFGNLTQMLEFTTSGKFKENNRFAGYINLPELVRIWSSVADTVLNKEIEKQRQERGEEAKIPKLEGDKEQDIYLPQSKALRSVMKYVKSELERYENMSGKEKKENSHIPLTMYGIAKAAAVDARLVVDDAADEPQSKTNEAVRQTLRSLEETKDYKGTIALFADNYQNKRSGFNLYEDIRKKLIEAGVPADQIAIIKSGMTIKKKQEIFDKVNSGEIRVIMGSTFTLGTGVNIQERLHTLIHLDAPNRPMDYTQRNGRILRQGNLHKQMGLPVRILRFGVEDSLDVTAYQRLKTKGAIADSIMHGQQMMANSMENRALEEEEDVFGDTVAQLSGSEYAMLKNQAEKDVRKYEAKKKQYEADQAYCHSEIPRLESEIDKTQKYFKRAESDLATVEKLPAEKTITIGKQKFADMESMGDFFKEYNKKVKEAENELRDNPSLQTQTRELTVNVAGIDFKFTTDLFVEVREDGASLFTAIHRKMTFSCEQLGIVDRSVFQGLLRNGIEDIMKNIVSGSDFRKGKSWAKDQLEMLNKHLSQIKERYGKPFEYTAELEKAHERYDEYSELMKKELEEKEKKYAEMDKDVDAATDVENAEEAEDESEDDDLFRYGDEDEDVLLAPNGKPSNLSPYLWSLVRTPEFKDWFGDWENDPEHASKVIDENGEPKVMYHSTNLDWVNKGEPFWQFYEDSHFGTKGQANDRMPMKEGVKMYEVFLNIRNPQRRADADQDYLDDKDMTMSEFWQQSAERAKSQGYDGIVYLNEYEDKEHPADSWIAFRPEQVKSATDNNGEFDSENADIRYRLREDDVAAKPQQTRVLTAKELKAREDFARRQWRRAHEVAKQTVDVLKLNDKVQVFDSIDDVPGNEKFSEKKRRAKGWYNRSDDKIYIVLGNHNSPSDVRTTILHEAVAHYSLRQLFGKNFDQFLDNVFRMADGDTRAKIVELAKKHKWDFRTATEEYLARLAEDTDFERAMDSGWWQRIKEAFLNMLKKVGLADFDTELTDNELRYILWRSYENLAEPGHYRNVFAEAKDVAMQAHLNVGNYKKGSENADTRLYNTDGQQAIPMTADLFREGDEPAEPASIARSIYEDAVKVTGNATMVSALFNAILNGKKGWEQFKHQFSESWFDYSRSIKALQDAIEKATGKKVAGFEDVWRSLNAKSSIDNIELQEVMRQYIEPLSEYVGNIIKGKKIDGKAVTIDDVEKYLNAVHGQERNVAMAMKQAQEEYDEDTLLLRKQLENASLTTAERSSIEESLLRKEARFKGIKDYMGYPSIAKWWRDWNMSVERGHNNGTLSDEEYNKVRAKMETEYNQGWQYKYRNKDYSGLTSLFADDFAEDEDVTEDMLEQAARDYAAKFEDVIGKAETDELWERVKALNNYSLRKSYLSGLISKQQYDDTLSMYEHYVPLRGWHDDYAGDVYQYISRGEPAEVLQGVLKKAYGRKSRAARIFGTMAAMANTAIVQGNKNVVAQKLLNLAMNHTDAGLLMPTEQWYQKDASDNLVPLFPELREDMTAEEMQDEIERFEADMKEREERGEVETLRKKFKKEFNLNMSKWQEQRHAVRVLRNGKEYMVYVLGDPRAAEAFNGLLNPHSQPGAISNVLSRYMRFRAQWQTSLSPEFLISNFQRDVMTATTGAYVKFGKDTSKQFAKNLTKVMPMSAIFKLKKNGSSQDMGGIFSLLRKYDQGTLNHDNDMERYFDEFVRNGGMTGISYITRSEEYQASMEDMVKRMRQGKLAKPRQVAKAIGNAVEFANKGIENATRFAMFMTSRQNGKTIVQSIFDAKEASVNFNMKGSGAWGNMMARRLYLYVNPAMQALRMLGTWYENNPVVATREGAEIVTKAVGKRFMKAAAFTLSASIATGVLNILFSALLGHGGGDDDDSGVPTDWWSLSEWNRYNYVNVINPFGRGYFHWNLPQELRPIWAIGQVAIDGVCGKITPQHGFNAMLSQLNNLTPLSFFEGGTSADNSTISSLIRTFTPTFVGEFTDAYGWNRDFIGHRITNQTNWNENSPEWQRAIDSTPRWLVDLSKEWNDFAPNGRTNNRSDWESRYLNPSALYYIFTQQYGGMGTMAKRLFQLGEQAFDPTQDMELRNVPFVPKLYVSTGDDYSQNRVMNEKFWMYWSEFKAADHELSRDRKAVKDGTMTQEEADKTIEERKADGSYQTWKTIHDNYLNKIYEEVRGTKDANEVKQMIVDAVENGTVPDFSGKEGKTYENAIKRQKTSKIDDMSDDEMREAFNASKDGQLRSLIAKRIAKSAGSSKDVYGEKSSVDYANIYQELRTANDVYEDALLYGYYELAKESGDEELKEQIKTERELIRQYARDLDRDYPSDNAAIMDDIRQERSELIRRLHNIGVGNR